MDRNVGTNCTQFPQAGREGADCGRNGGDFLHARPECKRQALHEKMERVFKDQGGDFYPVGTAQTYDGVRLVLRALDKVGPDPQKIRDALEEIDDFTEAVTKMKPHPFSRQNHESLGRDTGFLAVWHDGKVEHAE